jgi:hypothetical protein
MKARVQRARAQLHELLACCCEVAVDEGSGTREVRRIGRCGCSDS